ncbi:MAG: MFS transporter [Methylocystis sp.]|nr:MFS transporter [Methylocystis sp.]MCA3583232.1 MFS transporter [Methylocystis sp.]MCA3587563.1 MFS transporter [Methylocystis sp.]MCA3590690.1 MFS transporter [Methylocystis sp.]
MIAAATDPRYTPDSRYAWVRLALSLLLATVACVGSWSVVVALPEVQREFGTLRGLASFPYTCMMIGFAAAAIGMGKLTDRYGIVVPILIGAVSQGLGFIIAGFAPSILVFALAHVLIGIGASIGFAPLIADISHWFRQNRGLAVAITATGNYLAGALWSPLFQSLISSHGWRWTHIAVGCFVFVFMLAMAGFFRRRAARDLTQAAAVAARGRALGVSTNTLLVALAIAGFGCCMAMAMPQVHIVAYCADLGYGAARGAEMLSLMLALGIFSRIGSGFLADRIGGLSVLMIGSFMQAAALFLFLWFDGLTSLYIISAIFGLFQGGIVPMYALVAREYLPPEQAGGKIGIVITATILGMAVGGVASGWIFDYFLSYRMAFLNGLLWNGVNLLIVGWLLLRRRDAGGQPVAQTA